MIKILNPIAGKFQKVLPHYPEDWPWALPFIYAMNISSEIFDKPIRASATPSGEFISKSSKSTQFIVEVIGYWNGTFALIEVDNYSVFSDAQKATENFYNLGILKFIMREGQVIKENTNLNKIDQWPVDWNFKYIQSIGIFCSYLFDTSHKYNEELFKKFKEMIIPGSTWGEQLQIYLDALEFISANHSFDDNKIEQIALAKKTIKEWLK